VQLQLPWLHGATTLHAVQPITLQSCSFVSHVFSEYPGPQWQEKAFVKSVQLPPYKDKICPNQLMLRYTRTNLRSCSKSANKPSTSCVRTACQQICNNLVDIIRLVARLFQQDRYSHDITILLLQPCVVNLVTFLLYHDCIIRLVRATL
jgi:hypothetical protein